MNFRYLGNELMAGPFEIKERFKKISLTALKPIFVRLSVVNFLRENICKHEASYIPFVSFYDFPRCYNHSNHSGGISKNL